MSSAMALLFMVCSESADEAAKPTLILVVGASGVPQYEPMFSEWADRWPPRDNRDSIPSLLDAIQKFKDRRINNDFAPCSMKRRGSRDKNSGW